MLQTRWLVVPASVARRARLLVESCPSWRQLLRWRHLPPASVLQRSYPAGSREFRHVQPPQPPSSGSWTRALRPDFLHAPLLPTLPRVSRAAPHYPAATPPYPTATARASSVRTPPCSCLPALQPTW